MNEFFNTFRLITVIVLAVLELIKVIKNDFHFCTREVILFVIIIILITIIITI